MPKPNMKPWALERTGDSAELTMYGEVVESRPVSWRTGEPVEGDYIVQSEILEDMKDLDGVTSLTVRMNSVGGDCVVGYVIHNRMRELARGGTDITCIVDGVAMSAASVIMCAANRVKVNPVSLVMVHRCWSSFWGYYNASDLQKAADALFSYDKAILAAYTRKTGISEDDLTDMMEDETYLTGQEAVEKGFADELIEDAEPLNIAASANRTCFVVNGRMVRAPMGVKIPEDIPTVATGADATPAPADNNNLPEDSGEGGNDTMTLEELRQKHPELVTQIEASVSHDNAVDAERNRIREIDQIAGLFSDELVREAKYGEHPCTAQEMTYRAAQEAAKQGRAFMQALADDAKDSGAAGVGSVPPAGDEGGGSMSDEEKMAAGEAMAKRLAGKEV